MRKSVAAGAIGAAVAFGVFVALAQSQYIFVPYFTPSTIEFQGLQNSYRATDPVSFSIVVEGYGSNCHMVEVITSNEARGEQVSYYRTADDCRFMEISHGEYNFTRPFEYLLESPGDYSIDVKFEDLVTGQRLATRGSFVVA